MLIASYLEADNIGDVLKAVPTEVEGLAVSTLVVVDGGDDGTEDIVADRGAYCAVLPVNMGQGVALRLGYELAAAHGVKYVVTLDADGQNDPAEIGGFSPPCSTARPTSSSAAVAWAPTRRRTRSAWRAWCSSPRSSTR